MLVSAIEKNAEVSSNTTSVPNNQLKGIASTQCGTSNALENDLKHEFAADIGQK